MEDKGVLAFGRSVVAPSARVEAGYQGYPRVEYSLRESEGSPPEVPEGWCTPGWLGGEEGFLSGGVPMVGSLQGPRVA